MASAVEFSNRVWRASAAGSIDDDLAALWREVAREAPVSRAVMSNLVVFCRRAATDDVDLTSPPAGIPLDEVAGSHPARVVLLYHDPDTHAGSAAGAVLAAQVGVLAFGPADARYGVEHIVIQSVCTEDALPSIVRPLMLGDVPTSVWWTDDVVGTRPVAPLVTMGRQLLYDSRRWHDFPSAVQALAPLLAAQFAPDFADINWRRLLPVRQAIVHAVASSKRSKEPRLAAVRIRHRPGEAALAWLLAGWLQDAGRLGSDRPIAVGEDAALGNDLLTAVFDDGLQVRFDAGRVSVDDRLGPAPFTVPVPRESEGEAVAAELRALTHDKSLRHALSALVARFGKV